MLSEWIPFGTNQILALNDRLGATDRCQVWGRGGAERVTHEGGLFTAMVDKKPNTVNFKVDEGLTKVRTPSLT